MCLIFSPREVDGVACTSSQATDVLNEVGGESIEHLSSALLVAMDSSSAACFVVVEATRTVVESLGCTAFESMRSVPQSEFSSDKRPSTNSPLPSTSAPTSTNSPPTDKPTASVTDSRLDNPITATNPLSGPTGSGFSSGAIAAVVLGAVLGSLLIMGVLTWSVRWYRRRPPSSGSGVKMEELPGIPTGRPSPFSLLNPPSVHR